MQLRQRINVLLRSGSSLNNHYEPGKGKAGRESSPGLKRIVKAAPYL